MIKKIYDYDITKIKNGSILVYTEKNITIKFYYSRFDEFIEEFDTKKYVYEDKHKEVFKEVLNEYCEKNGTLEWEK